MKTAILIVACFLLLGACKSDTNVLFSDDFGPGSQGEWADNVIQHPPPVGLDYKWNVTLGGHLPIGWTLVDRLEADNPKKGFWVIISDSACLQQAGRSHDAILFCSTAVPEEALNYDIEFRQIRMDNDYIGFIVGSQELAHDAGFEFGYMTQVPGTDSTTRDVYMKGALGESLLEGQAFMRQWASHRIEVREGQVSWYQNNELMASGRADRPLHGYFGMRQRYERNTCIDDFKITLK